MAMATGRKIVIASQIQGARGDILNVLPDTAATGHRKRCGSREYCEMRIVTYSMQHD